MARLEFQSADMNGVGLDANGEIFFQLGLSHAVGNDGEPDLVAAHKWFNLAAMKGNREAMIRRKELTCEMSACEVSRAQREAREWIRMH
ncbi:MAG: hypothetical protein OIF56_02375 [Cohaesibacter sp.]|nr:hypothetical protein [Cohaesibacter sp.]